MLLNDNDLSAGDVYTDLWIHFFGNNKCLDYKEKNPTIN